jgi:tRNA threonylcarbamoyl adenosine modification protein YeaZ
MTELPRAAGAGTKTVLAVDTSTPIVVTGVAEVTDGAVRELALGRAENARGHAEVLTTLILTALTDAGVRRDDLDAVVVGCGPGPFTGLRVGIATGAGFGDALGLPVYGVCSLDAIAVQAFSAAPQAHDLLVVTDARRREVYYARYADGARVDGPAVSGPADLHEALADTRIDRVAGWPSHAAPFGEVIGGTEAPDVVGLVTAALPDIVAGTTPRPLEPLYLRRPDAVERAPGRRL